MNVEPPETFAIIESIVYKSNGFAIYKDTTMLCPNKILTNIEVLSFYPSIR